VASISAEVGDGAREPSGRIRAAAAVWFGRLHVDLLGEDEEGGLAEKRPARVFFAESDRISKLISHLTPFRN
jgi:hypothetical protein